MNRLYILTLTLGFVGSGFSEGIDVKEENSYTLFVDEPVAEVVVVEPPALEIFAEDEVITAVPSSEEVSVNESPSEQQVTPPRRRVRRSSVKTKAEHLNREELAQKKKEKPVRKNGQSSPLKRSKKDKAVKRN